MGCFGGQRVSKFNVFGVKMLPNLSQNGVWGGPSGVLGTCWESIEPNFEFLARLGDQNGLKIDAKSVLLALFFLSLFFEQFLERA